MVMVMPGAMPIVLSCGEVETTVRANNALETVPAYDLEIDAERWKDRVRVLLKERF